MSAVFPQNKWNGPKLHDPWWKAEEWRYEHPLVAKKYFFKNLLPGFGYATVAFALYCTGEFIFNNVGEQKEDNHHKDNKH
jgi:NADH dehydrogenase (ubiquinone) 1 beta subcomplex subunit 3